MIGDARLATLIATGSLLAAGAGYGAAVALGQEGEPTQTVTIDVATGPQGDDWPARRGRPAWPAGPRRDRPGLRAASTCPTGFAPAVVVFNAPGGQEIDLHLRRRASRRSSQASTHSRRKRRRRPTRDDARSSHRGAQRGRSWQGYIGRRPQPRRALARSPVAPVPLVGSRLAVGQLTPSRPDEIPRNEREKRARRCSTRHEPSCSRHDYALLVTKREE